MDFIWLLLAAIALSKTLDYYADTETSDMSSSPVVTTNEDEESDAETNEKNNRNLYDKAGKSKNIAGRRPPAAGQQDGEEDANIVSSNIKTIVVICSKSDFF